MTLKPYSKKTLNELEKSKQGDKLIMTETRHNATAGDLRVSRFFLKTTTPRERLCLLSSSCALGPLKEKLMRDNLLTLSWKAKHPIKYQLIRAGAWIIAILLLPLILTYLVYLTIKNGGKS